MHPGDRRRQPRDTSLDRYDTTLQDSMPVGWEPASGTAAAEHQEQQGAPNQFLVDAHESLLENPPTSVAELQALQHDVLGKVTHGTRMVDTDEGRKKVDIFKDQNKRELDADLVKEIIRRTDKSWWRIEPADLADYKNVATATGLDGLSRDGRAFVRRHRRQLNEPAQVTLERAKKQARARIAINAELRQDDLITDKNGRIDGRAVRDHERQLLAFDFTSELAPQHRERYKNDRGFTLDGAKPTKRFLVLTEREQQKIRQDFGTSAAAFQAFRHDVATKLRCHREAAEAREAAKKLQEREPRQAATIARPVAVRSMSRIAITGLSGEAQATPDPAPDPASPNVPQPPSPAVQPNDDTKRLLERVRQILS